MKEFKFNLGQQVIIACSGERGEVVGRAQYKSSDDTYLIRCKAADGRAVQYWWGQEALEAIEEVDS